MGCASTARCGGRSPTSGMSTRGCGASASATGRRTPTSSRSAGRSRGPRTAWRSASASWCRMSATRSSTCGASSRLRAASGTRSRVSSPSGGLCPAPPYEGGGQELQAFRHLYLHIPFSRHKCGYCDFNAYAGTDRLMPDYVDALERELIFARERFPFQQVETVYLGGGTPSLLPADLASRFLEFVHSNFNVAPDAEVTLEANPASTDEARLAAWREGGVNRLSLGVQGFDQRALAVLERKTDAAQATRAFALARDAGFSNISIDLIYAVPFQSLDTWIETLRRAIALEPDHVSTYCLSFEEGTLLFRRRAEGRVPEVDPICSGTSSTRRATSSKPRVITATR